MTFDEVLARPIELRLGGVEAVGLCVALARIEHDLDTDQRAALDRVRAVLYGELTVEEMECLEALYERSRDGASSRR